MFSHQFLIFADAFSVEKKQNYIRESVIERFIKGFVIKFKYLYIYNFNSACTLLIHTDIFLYIHEHTHAHTVAATSESYSSHFMHFVPCFHFSYPLLCSVSSVSGMMIHILTSPSVTPLVISDFVSVLFTLCTIKVSLVWSTCV